MKILLASSNLENSPAPVFPLGLSVLAKSLRQAGHEIQIFDWLTHDGQEESLRAVLAAFSPELIGIGVRNIDNVDSLNLVFYLDDLLRMTTLIRQLSPAPIVLGGAGYSLLPEDILAFTGADYGIVGAGEEAMPQLADTLAKGQSIAKIIRASTPRFFGGADYDRNILSYYLSEGGAAPLQTKRGCPHNCVYCAYPLLEGSCVRSRDTDELLCELDFLRREYSPSLIYFTDSIFNAPGGSQWELLDRMARQGISIPWTAFFSPQKFTAEEIGLMKRTGLKVAELGLDALCDTTLKGLGKNYDFSCATTAVSSLRRTGATVSCSAMAGGPQIFDATLREGMQNLKMLDTVPVFVFMGIRILPNTPLEAIARHEGVLSAGESFLRPKFYLSPKIAPEKLYQVLREGTNSLKNLIFPPQSRNESLRKLRLALGGKA